VMGANPNAARWVETMRSFSAAYQNDVQWDVTRATSTAEPPPKRRRHNDGGVGVERLDLGLPASRCSETSAAIRATLSISGASVTVTRSAAATT
jgi:hypothetical protein